MVSRIIEQGQSFPFIIIAPQCPQGKYRTSGDWFDFLFIDITQKYRIDTTSIFVTGISNGGYETYAVAMRYPDKFAASETFLSGHFMELPTRSFP